MIKIKRTDLKKGVKIVPINFKEVIESIDGIIISRLEEYKYLEVDYYENYSLKFKGCSTDKWNENWFCKHFKLLKKPKNVSWEKFITGD